MYLKTHKRKKNGKYHEYYSIAEKRKISRGRYVEKIVLYLGEISDSQKKSWQKSIEILSEDNKPIYKSLFAIDNETHARYDVDTIPIKLSKMKLSKSRTFGGCFAGLRLRDCIEGQVVSMACKAKKDCIATGKDLLNDLAYWNIKPAVVGIA